MFNRVTHNDQVLLAGGVFENRLPGTNAWIFLKVEDNNKKPVSVPSAGTVADSELQPKFQRHAPLAAIPMLQAGAEFKSGNK